jgi:hypothetical protein
MSEKNVHDGLGTRPEQRISRDISPESLSPGPETLASNPEVKAYQEQLEAGQLKKLENEALKKVLEISSADTLESESSQKSRYEQDRFYRHASSAQKNASYKTTMHAIQSEMRPSARIFSQLIHNPAVEKISSSIGSTLARPNAIVTGSTFAIIAVSSVYAIARTYGYPLSGSETIIAFAIGWVTGLIFDYARTALKR